jgi:preprotein translocase subunit SecG
MPVNSSKSAGIVTHGGPASREPRGGSYKAAPPRTERRVNPVTVAFSVILIITSLLMVLLVLLHKGKGGGLSDLFGGGISSSLGSSSVVERNLDRITIFTGIIWFISIVVLGFLEKH